VHPSPAEPKPKKENHESCESHKSGSNRIRERIAARFGGDAYAIAADARTRMEKSGCTIIRRAPAANRPVRETK